MQRIKIATVEGGRAKEEEKEAFIRLYEVKKCLPGIIEANLYSTIYHSLYRAYHEVEGRILGDAGESERLAQVHDGSLVLEDEVVAPRVQSELPAGHL